MTLKEKLGAAKEPLYLIDGSSFLYRGFYAYADLSRSDGFPTNALFIVMRLLLRLLREEKPRYAVFFLDGRGPNFRHELYPEYKANRQAMPEPLAMQIEPLKEGVGLLGLRLEVSSGLEADDLIAGMAARFKSERPVVIVASDKDLRQCLDEGVVLWDPAGKADKIVTRRDFEAEYGIAPERWPDFQALTGDAADNIPGVPGVGPKTALDILRRLPSLEAVRDKLDELKPAQRRKIEEHVEKTFLYRELTRLRADPPAGETIADLAVQRPDLDRVREFLNRYEFRSMARELSGVVQEAPASKAVAVEAAGGGRPAGPGQEQLSLFSPAPATVPEKASPVSRLSCDQLPDLAGKRLGLVPEEGGWRLGFEGREFLATGEPAVLARAVSKASLAAAPSVKDLLRAHPAFFEVPLPAWFDLGLAAYLLNPEQRNYSWERLRDALFSDPALDRPDLSPADAGGAALALAELLGPRLAAAGCEPLVRDLELPLAPVLARMEQAGVGIDLAAFGSFLDEVNAELEALTARIREAAGREVNLRSSRQLAELLFDTLGLKRQGKTPGGAVSTSSEVLERLVGAHPAVDLILRYRKLEKLRSTYLEPLPRLVDDKGRLHTTFNQLATATGRLSSSNPNLQNIPIRGDQGRRMRACFIAAPGMLLAGADYSQIELRVLAHLSKEPTLLAAFAENRDIHAETAAMLYDKPISRVGAEERRNAKTINFGLLYGMGPQKLSRELGMKLDEAKAFIAKYFERLQKLREFYETVVAEAEENGQVTTLAGRRRLLPDIRSRNAQLASQARRQAVNTVVQGGAADIIKMAMLAVDADAELASLGARLLLQVHDELLLEVPQAGAARAAGRLAEIMTGVIRLDAPLVADAGLGANWALAH